MKERKEKIKIKRKNMYVLIRGKKVRVSLIKYYIICLISEGKEKREKRR